jgi:hypothetical protein
MVAMEGNHLSSGKVVSVLVVYSNGVLWGCNYRSKFGVCSVLERCGMEWNGSVSEEWIGAPNGMWLN